jgi:membrane-associated protein
MLFIWGGYWFGNIPLVRDNFALVTIGIIIVSLLPIVGVLLQQRLTGAVAVPRGSGRPRAG